MGRPGSHPGREQQSPRASRLPIWILCLSWFLLQSAGCAYTGTVEQPAASHTGSFLTEETATPQEAVPPAGTATSPTDKGPRPKAKKKPAPNQDFTQPPPPAKPPAIGGTEG